MIRFTKQLGIAVTTLLIWGCCEPLVTKEPTTPPPPPPPPPVAEVEAPEPPAPSLVLLSSGKSNTVSLRFVFDTGSADDPEDKKGLTRLTATLMAEGGTEALSYPELKEKLFPMAADIDVHVGRDQTVFYGKAHRDHLDQYYALVRDVLLIPRLGETDFNRIHKKMQSDLTQTLRGNDDEELGKAALAWKMYQGHPYGPPTLGTEAGLSAITLDDVKAHRQRVMCSSRLTVGMAGAVDEAFAQKVSEDLKALPSGCEPRPDLPALPVPKGREVILIDKPTAVSTAISIGFPIDVRRGDPDYAALKLTEAYFGQHRTFSGVLQTRLREKRGFNYGDYAYAEHFEQAGWSRAPRTNIARRQQYFSIWIRPVKDTDKHFVLRLALYEMTKLIDNGIPKEEFEKTRTFMKRYYLTFTETQQQQIGYALDDRFYGLQTPYLQKLFADLDGLTVEAVNSAIKKHLTKDSLVIAMVTKDAGKLADALAADAPSPVTYSAPKPADIQAEDKAVQELKLGIWRDAITIVPVDEIFK